jgi:hypothetical protein
MGMNLRRMVSRRQVLKIGAAASTTLGAWAAGVVPELVSAKGSGSGDQGRQLTNGEVQAYLSHLHAPDADRFTAHLKSLGHQSLPDATTGATRTFKGQSYVLLELAFSNVDTTGATVYVVLQNSILNLVAAVQHGPSADGGKHAQEFLIGAAGTVINGRAATMYPDGSFRVVDHDGTVKTLTQADIIAAGQKHASQATAAGFGVMQAEATNWCYTCNLAGGLVSAIGCGIGVWLASLLCGPALPICVLLVIILAGTWCWAVFALGTLFTCCDAGYCNWCYDCASC